MTRVTWRDYPASWPRRAKQITRVHVLNEAPPKGREPGTEALCGTSAGRHTNSRPVIAEAPLHLPEGLTWCPTCIGRLAERKGVTALMAHMLGLTNCVPPVCAPDIKELHRERKGEL